MTPRGERAPSGCRPRDPSTAGWRDAARRGQRAVAHVRRLEIRDARGGELVAGCALLARSLGFGRRDALPPWLVQTAAAPRRARARRVPRRLRSSASRSRSRPSRTRCSRAGSPSTPAAAGRGVGRRLKLAQRDRALADGPQRHPLDGRAAVGGGARALPRRAGRAARRLRAGALRRRPAGADPARRRRRSSGGSTGEPRGTGGARRPASRCRSTIGALDAAASSARWRMRVRRAMTRALDARRGRDGRGARSRRAPGLGALPEARR